MEGESKKQNQRSNSSEINIESVEEIDDVESTTDAKSIIVITSVSFTLEKKNLDINGGVLIVPQYIETYSKDEKIYAVTYSGYGLIMVWSINIEKNGKQQLDVCFESNYPICNIALYKNFLLLETDNHGENSRIFSKNMFIKYFISNL